ncbi:MAG: hypothetical protein JO042_07555 [Sinobacteraceae bacterium]|nr:hypothetical protein [Nevskiaceae bacterium]
MEYAVKAETRDGRIMIVKRGFASQEEAEDHPIRMARWKRVWVEEVPALHGEVAGYIRRWQL